MCGCNGTVIRKSFVSAIQESDSDLLSAWSPFPSFRLPSQVLLFCSPPSDTLLRIWSGQLGVNSSRFTHSFSSTTNLVLVGTLTDRWCTFIHLSNSLLLIHIPFFATQTTHLLGCMNMIVPVKSFSFPFFQQNRSLFKLKSSTTYLTCPHTFHVTFAFKGEKHRRSRRKKFSIYINFKDITNFLLF